MSTTSVQSGNGLVESDMHETAVVDGKTMLIPIYEPRAYNLERYGLDPGQGWILDGVFQEVDIETGDVLFQWNAIDHVSVEESYSLLDEDGGGTEDNPWDYFHINSIDKNANGDYVVSARHTNAIYKISGQDGSVMWRLGGSHPDIEQTNYNFSAQHDARFRQENDTTTVLSLFDNASDRYTNTSSISSGMLVSIDHGTNYSTLIRQYAAPGDVPLSWSQGNMQILPNKNVIVGWGSVPAISEHLEDGTPVFFATVEDPLSMNYRWHKSNWTGEPADPPSLKTYSESPMSGTTFWMSWNGATEVDYWNIYATTNTSEEFTHLDYADRIGFETTYYSPDYHPRAFAEAVAKDGTSLANSSIITTYPAPGTRKSV